MDEMVARSVQEKVGNTMVYIQKQKSFRFVTKYGLPRKDRLLIFRGKKCNEIEGNLMAPRNPKGAEAMTSSERVRQSRMVNKIEDTADELLTLLKDAPQPLPREPMIQPELLELLFEFKYQEDEVAVNDEYDNVRFLTLGNGHQVANKRRALACASQVLPGAKVLDKKTIELPKWGTCHFSSYTSPKAAMISTPKRDDHSYGSAEWHKRDHVVLFRDAGDGRCIIYVCDIPELFENRATTSDGKIRHGVLWPEVTRIAKETIIVPSVEARGLVADV